MKDTNYEPFPQDPVEQLRWFAKHGVPAASDSDDRLIWAADEIERLRDENETLRAFAAKASDEKMLLLRELKDAE